jgi:hypothetical protein
MQVTIYRIMTVNVLFVCLATKHYRIMEGTIYFFFSLSFFFIFYFFFYYYFFIYFPITINIKTFSLFHFLYHINNFLLLFK